MCLSSVYKYCADSAKEKEASNAPVCKFTGKKATAYVRTGGDSEKPIFYRVLDGGEGEGAGIPCRPSTFSISADLDVNETATCYYGEIPSYTIDNDGLPSNFTKCDASTPATISKTKSLTPSPPCEIPMTDLPADILYGGSDDNGSYYTYLSVNDKNVYCNASLYGDPNPLLPADKRFCYWRKHTPYGDQECFPTGTASCSPSAQAIPCKYPTDATKCQDGFIPLPCSAPADASKDKPGIGGYYCDADGKAFKNHETIIDKAINFTWFPYVITGLFGFLILIILGLLLKNMMGGNKVPAVLAYGGRGSTVF